MAKAKTSPSWSDVKAKLQGFGQDGLVALIHDLYLASKDNRVFLHTRFALDGEALEPYKRTIERWIFPDIFRNAPHSVAKAKAAFSSEVALDDEGYYDALVRMYGRALDGLPGLPGRERVIMLARLNEVREVCEDVGYGVCDDMERFLVNHARVHGIG